MKIIIILPLFLLSTILISCASTRQIHKKKNLNTKVVFASSENIIIKIPEGWNEIDDNGNRLFEIWLVNKNNSSSIGFIPINLDSSFISYSIPQKLDLLEKLMIDRKNSNGYTFEILNSANEEIGYAVKNIQYKIDGTFKSSILFGSKLQFYECIAYFDGEFEITENSVNDIIRLQKKIISTSKLF